MFGNDRRDKLIEHQGDRISNLKAEIHSLRRKFQTQQMALNDVMKDLEEVKLYLDIRWSVIPEDAKYVKR